MAQYYHPRITTSSVTSEAYFLAISPRNTSQRYPSVENAAGSSSILVFPSPPSERESSKDGSNFEFSGSTPSLPTDVSFNSSSRSRSGDNPSENERSWHNISETLIRRPDERILEEAWELDLDTNGLRDGWDDMRYISHSKERDRMRTHTHTPSSVSILSGATSTLIPQPPFRPPFLSWLQKIFNLDEFTLHLLTRSPNPHTSVLFPFSPGPPLTCDECLEEEPPHGILKLLLHNPDKPGGIPLFKSVFDPCDDITDPNPFLTTPTQLPVMQFLESMIAGSLRVWREIQDSHTRGGPRLIGV